MVASGYLSLRGIAHSSLRYQKADQQSWSLLSSEGGTERDKADDGGGESGILHKDGSAAPAAAAAAATTAPVVVDEHDTEPHFGFAPL